MNTSNKVSTPAHVCPERVFDFDLHNRKGNFHLQEDLHQGLKYLHDKAPEIFWTPYNGGHWVVTRFALLAEIAKDHRHFGAVLELPLAKEPTRALPLTVDPPEHTPYRHIVMRFFSPRALKEIDTSVRRRARELVDTVASRSECDFVSSVAVPLPVSVFMELVGWPLSRFAEFRAVVEELFSSPGDERRREISDFVAAEMAAMLQERRNEPRNDLMTRLLAEEIDGRKLSTEEMLSICFFFFAAGLDTVANALGFIFKRLAQEPGAQQRLEADPLRIPDFIDEALRVSGVVNSLRRAKANVEIGGVQIHEGDIVACMLPLAGLDERVHDHPTAFDMDRASHANLMFSTGVHLCAGHHLARLEIRILVEEWLKTIPFFSLAPDYRNEFRLGTIMSLKSLHLVWPTRV